MFCKVVIMSVEKKPLSEKEFDKILQAATRTSEEARRVILIFRYTGMHVSVLAEPNKYDLRIEDGEIIWDRPKKKGKVAYTSIPISNHLDFDVNEFITDLKKRKKRGSRQYFYDIVKECGEKAGISGTARRLFRNSKLSA